jgi:hypothetical protein
VFASVVPAAAVGSPDFSLSLSAQSTTVASSGLANLMVSASAVGGFNGQISLSCSAPAGLTCSFNPSTVSPGSSAPSSTLIISTVSTPPVTGYRSLGMGMLLRGMGPFGTLPTSGERKSLALKSILSTGALGLLLVISLFAVGCSNTSKGKRSHLRLL